LISWCLQRFEVVALLAKWPQHNFRVPFLFFTDCVVSETMTVVVNEAQGMCPDDNGNDGGDDGACSV
jgi:hypothetical protein